MRIKNIEKVPKPDAPKFFDVPVGELQDILKDKLTWLDYSFGRCQRLVDKKGNKERHYPGIHIKNKQYINVLPSKEYQDFSFFLLKDPQEVDFISHTTNKVTSKYALIFWLNLDGIFANDEDRNTESIKAEILKVLTRGVVLSNARLTVTSISELSENIYNEFDIREIDSQFLMQPYYGVRFDGELTMTEPC